MIPVTPARLRVFAGAVFIGLLASASSLHAWTSYQLHDMMGRGINYGQYYENKGTRNNAALGAIPQSHFAAIKAAGFDHVRIPVTWGYRMTFPSGSTGTPAIKTAFLDSVQTSVDRALAEDLVVVINTHHERWFQYYWAAKNNQFTIKLRESGTEPYSGDPLKPWDYVMTDRAQGGRLPSEIYSAIYTQMVTRFTGPEYDKVIFEGLNEPEQHYTDKGTGQQIDAFPLSATGRQRVNDVNQLAFDIVQANHNPNNGQARRTYLMTVNNMNNSKEFKFLTMPAYGGWDAATTRNRLMITLHYYTGMPWTHPSPSSEYGAKPTETDTGNSKWPYYYWGRTDDYDALIERLDEIDSSVPANFSQTNSPLVGVPVNIGEFGIAHRERTNRDTDDVLEWYRAVSAGALQRDFSATVWCDNGNFRVFNQSAGDFTHAGQPDYVAEIWKHVTLFENRWRFAGKANVANRLAVDAVANYTKWYLRAGATGDAQVFTFELAPAGRLSDQDSLKYFALRSANGGVNGRYLDLAGDSFASGTQVQSSVIPLDTVLDHYVYLSFEGGTGAHRLVTRLGQQQYPERTANDMVIAAPNGLNAITVLNTRAGNDNQRWVMQQGPN